MATDEKQSFLERLTGTVQSARGKVDDVKNLFTEVRRTVREIKSTTAETGTRFAVQQQVREGTSWVMENKFIAIAIAVALFFIIRRI